MLPNRFGFLGEDLHLIAWSESRHIPADSLQEALKNYLSAYDSHAVIVYFETACKKNIQLYTAVSEDGLSLLPEFLEGDDAPYLRIYTDRESCKQESCTLFPIRIRAFLRKLHSHGMKVSGIILNPDDTPFLITWEYLKDCISSAHYNAE